MGMVITIGSIVIAMAVMVSGAIIGTFLIYFGFKMGRATQGKSPREPGDLGIFDEVRSAIASMLPDRSGTRHPGEDDIDDIERDLESLYANPEGDKDRDEVIVQ